MSNLKQSLFFLAPNWLKELGVAWEARRRNSCRRHGDYKEILRAHDFAQYWNLPLEEVQERQLRSLNALIRFARQHCPFYRDRLPFKALTGVDEIVEIPILTKNDAISSSEEMIAEGFPLKRLWRDRTSGSTGTPWEFCVGREGIRARFAIQDNYYRLHGCIYGERRARISGAQVASVRSEQPPFWVFNRVDNQLQMSAYHLSDGTIPLYIEAINAFAAKYITGYAHAIYLLANHVRQRGRLAVPIKAVFPDSEPLLPEYRVAIDDGLRTRCYDTYGLGEVGLIAVECPGKQYATLSLSHVVEVVDEEGRQVTSGQQGRIVVTDLTQYAVPFLRYDTGDIGMVAAHCTCDWHTTLHLKAIEGRLDDMILTPKGCWVGRLSHVTKPGVGILESQIVQKAIHEVEIRVVPAENFEPDSMRKVLNVARGLLGDEVHLSWRLVAHIPRTSAHKFKHVIRLIDEKPPGLG
jgi:phenylacetate-CoA ligase